MGNGQNEIGELSYLRQTDLALALLFELTSFLLMKSRMVLVQEDDSEIFSGLALRNGPSIESAQTLLLLISSRICFPPGPCPKIAHEVFMKVPSLSRFSISESNTIYLKILYLPVFRPD